MLSGFNTNVRHRGVLFHVQSEDSGRAHPHVITHLYHGGTILASEKCSYGEHLEAPDLMARVRGLMEAQHGAMLARLRAGELDDAIASRLGPDVLGPAKEEPAPDSTAAGHTQRQPAGHKQHQPAAAPARSAPGVPAADPVRVAAGAERPLDELILDYLVETTRRERLQRSQPGRPAAGGSRKLE